MSATQTTSSNQNPSSQITEYFDAAGPLLIAMTEEREPQSSLKGLDADDDGGGDESSSLICPGETVVIVSRSDDVKGWDGVALFGQTHRQNMSLLQVQQNAYADVCRICHCGQNTLANPTPTILTPVTSPKKFNNNAANTTAQSPTTIHQVSVQLKSQLATRDCPQQENPAPSPPPPTIITHQPPSSPNKKKKKPQGAPPPDYNLISPCICSGSLKYVHQCCLQHWIRASNNTSCELCKYPYELRSRFKPLWKWESLPMNSREKKRIVCSALFHTVALACVVWSLYVLIDRTIEELTHSDLEWQFWTKIIVEAIGCLGAGILTYVWGKSYVGLFVKWISFNRSFVILGKEHRNSIPNHPAPETTETTQQRPANSPTLELPGTSAAAGQSQPTELNTAYYKQL